MGFIFRSCLDNHIIVLYFMAQVYKTFETKPTKWIFCLEILNLIELFIDKNNMTIVEAFVCC